ncbi:MAG: RNA polymerase sigma factor [Clostridia bacterium]|nr:RNA polymerase sigma factor [Clostridia bacterium]
MDAVTFQAEVKRIERLMYRVAWSYLGNNQDVEDAVQDAIVKAWEKRESLRRQEPFKPWLTRILVNHWDVICQG